MRTELVNQADILRRQLASLEVNDDFTQAVVSLADGSRLCFCHRVDDRSAEALAPEQADNRSVGDPLEHTAEQLLAAMHLFRLNARHLEIWFRDGSSWEAVFADGGHCG